MRIILLKGSSSYDLLRTFIDELDAALKAAGHQSIVIDLISDLDLLDALQQCVDGGKVDFLFSFNVFGEITDPRGRSLGEIVGAPHLVHHVDYPLSHLERLEKTSARAAVLTIDQSHVDLIHSIYGKARFAFAGFLPHAAIGPTVSPGNDPAQFLTDRPIPILFPGTLYKTEVEPWREMAPRIQKIFDAAMEMALGTEWIPPLDALDKAMLAFGLAPGNPDFSGFRKLATYVHEQVRIRRRFQILDAAERLGIPLYVVGKGYDQHGAQYRNLVRLGEVSLVDSAKLMTGSRVVLSVNVNFGAGSHERPLMALNAGAATATDSSLFYDANFEAGVDMAFYRWGALEDGLEAVARLSNDPAAAFAMATSGQRKVAASHLWSNRISTIIAAAGQARARWEQEGWT